MIRLIALLPGAILLFLTGLLVAVRTESAFAYLVFDDGEGSPGGNIYVAWPDGSHRRQISPPNDGYHYLPLFSPDGAWIAYQWDTPDGLRLRLSPITGGAAKELWTERLSANIKYLKGWTADSRGLLTVMLREFEIGDVSIAWLNDDENVFLQCPGCAAHVIGSPDANWIYIAGSGMYRFAVSSPGSPTLEEIVPKPTHLHSLVWSPDGEWFAFFGSRLGGETGIFRLRPDGSDLQLIYATQHTRSIYGDFLRWSSDSQRLFLFTEQGQVIAVPREGGQARIVAENARELIGALGQWVYYLDRDGNLVRTPFHEQSPEILAPLPDAANLSFSPALDLPPFRGRWLVLVGLIWIGGVIFVQRL